jgi:hypothetical protein
MFKLTNKNMENRDVTWKIGLNKDIHPFNTEEECCAGGIYFCSKEQLVDWCDNYTHICDIEIPKNAQIHHYGNKSKASKMIIKTHMSIEDHPVFNDPEFGVRFVSGGGSIRYVKEQTPEICMAAVKKDVDAFIFVKEQTPEICMADVEHNGNVLIYVVEQTPEICLAAVKSAGCSLQYVKEQTPELCMISVKQYGHYLQYVKEQTPEICLAAVKSDGWSLQYVKEQTPEICLAAVKQVPYAFQYVQEPNYYPQFSDFM